MHIIIIILDRAASVSAYVGLISAGQTLTSGTSKHYYDESPHLVLALAGTAYGAGDYFARDASYSQSYSTNLQPSPPYHMLLNIVSVGDFCPGNGSMKAPPSRDGSSDPDGTNLFNTTTDNQTPPSIYVSYHDAQKYPAYLIEFK